MIRLFTFILIILLAFTSVYPQKIFDKEKDFPKLFQLGFSDLSLINQVGNDNYALTVQSLNYGIIDVLQFGNFNLIEAYQSQLNKCFSGINLIYINQIGDYNQSFSNQTGVNNVIEVFQLSDYNFSEVKQYNYENLLVLLQMGGGSNKLSLQQSNNSEAEILQDGFGNLIAGDPIALSENSSRFLAAQLGDVNVIRLAQMNYAAAVVIQKGQNNTSIIVQQ